MLPLAFSISRHSALRTRGGGVALGVPGLVAAGLLSLATVRRGS